jgi:ribokinase
VCVLGSVNMDLVVRAPRLPAPGETVLGGAYRTYPGGKGANQAVAARRMGAAVAFVGALGDDPHGVKLRQVLDEEGIDLTHLKVRAGETSGLGLITVGEAGENTIVVASGANATVTPADADAARDAIAAASILLLQLEVPLPTVARAIAIAKEAGRRVILNAAPARPLPLDVMRQVDVLVVNRSEAARMVSMDVSSDPAKVSVRLPELGPPVVVMTLGALGSMISHRGRPRRLGAPSVHAVDATCAGDAFCGALAAWWGAADAGAPRSPEESRTLERAVRIASAAGALAATKAGAIPSLPTREQVLELAERAGPL